MSRDMVSRESATGPVGLRRRFAALFGAGALLVAGCATAGGAGGGGSAPDDQAVSALAESANLDQCANGAIGDPPATCTGSQWQNGNLNPNNSQYFEKSSVPFRLRFGGLTPATSHTVVIDWDTTHSADDHTYDYLTTYDTTEAGADPCSGVVGCDPGVFTTFPVPADPNIPADPNWSGTVIPGNLTMFGGTITGVSSYTLNGSYTSGSASDTEVTVTFTTDVAAPVLAWAGHVASQDDWGSGHAAADISGSPYHMRVLALDGSGGNQDRALSVSPPLSAVRVYLDAVPDGAQDFDFTLTGPDPQSFVLDDDTDPTRSNTRTMTSLTAGTYTLTQAQLPGWALTSLTCSGGTTTVDAAAGTVTIELADGDLVDCFFANERSGSITIVQDTQPDSPQDLGFTTTGLAVGSFDLDDDGDATLPNTRTFGVPPGTYTFTQGLAADLPLTGLDCVVTSGAGATTGTDIPSRTATIELTDDSSVTCTFTNAETASTIGVTKTVTPDPVTSGGTATFGVDVENPSPVAVTITSLADDVYGDVADGANAAIASTSCVLPQVVNPSDTYSCEFTATVSAPAGSTHTDTVTADGTDADGDPVTAGDSASAAVVAPPDPQGTVIVRQDTQPNSPQDVGFNGSGGVGSFNLDDDGDATLSDSRSFDLDPGTYTFTQDLLADLPLTGLDCVVSAGGATTTIDLANRSATVDLTDGSIVTCTFTNAETPSTIGVTKTVSPDPLVAGGSATFGVTVENTSPVAVTITSLSDDVYGDVADATNPAIASTSCSLPQTLAASATYVCGFTATVSEPAGSTHADTVTGDGTDDDGDPVTAGGSASAPVIAATLHADVNVTKTVDPSSLASGATAKFTMVVTNIGPDDAMNVTVDDVLPNGLAYQAATTSGGSYDSSTGRWTIGTLAMNATATLSIDTVVSGDVTNTALVSTTSSDPNPDDNMSTATVDVAGDAASPGPTGSEAAPAQPTGGAVLAFTGISGRLLAIGFLALCVGMLLLAVGRGRREQRR